MKPLFPSSYEVTRAAKSAQTCNFLAPLTLSLFRLLVRYDRTAIQFRSRRSYDAASHPDYLYDCCSGPRTVE